MVIRFLTPARPSPGPSGGPGLVLASSVARRRYLRAPTGVALVEVLVATVILAIGLVAVACMVTHASVSHQQSVNYTIAAERVTQEIERIRDAGYLGANVGTTLFPSPGYTVVNATQATFPVDELRNGTGTITLGEDTQAQATNPTTGLPYSNLKRLTVRITWGGSHKLQGSYQAVTLIANRP